MPSIRIRAGSRKPDSPGMRTNQVYGITADTRTPSRVVASGT